MATGRDDGFAALIDDQVMQFFCIIGPVCENLFAGDPVDQIAGWSHVVLLPRPQLEPDGQVKCIHYGVDFRAEPAPRPSESLGLSAPLFTRAPEA